MRSVPAALSALAALVALALSADPTAAAAQERGEPAAERVLGSWLGTLELGAMRLRLAIDVGRDSAGALRGTLTSLDQGNQRIPASVALRGDSVVVEVPRLQVRYAALLSTDGDSLRGTFTQGPGTLPLAMGRVTALPEVRRPQHPAPPFPYRSEEVVVESVPGVRLAGTLVLPPGEGPFPAVALVTGSGPQDRDETLLGHKPFLVLADHLARHGIASLRVDDRGVGRSTGRFATATTADFADDAEAMVHHLRARPEIADDRVGIVGHSEGGVVGPMVAARSDAVAFLVLLAGTGVPGDSLVLLQTRALLALAGADPATAERILDVNRQVYAAVKASDDSAATAARVTEIFDRYLTSLPAAERSAATADALRQATAGANTPWFRYFLRHDPRPVLRRVRVPVLAVNGTLDVQVPHGENLPAIERALQEGGNRDHRVVALPGLNHLFQTATTGAVAEYGALEETMSPTLLELVTRWIVERVGVGSRE